MVDLETAKVIGAGAAMFLSVVLLPFRKRLLRLANGFVADRRQRTLDRRGEVVDRQEIIDLVSRFNSFESYVKEKLTTLQAAVQTVGNHANRLETEAFEYRRGIRDSVNQINEGISDIRDSVNNLTQQVMHLLSRRDHR